MTHNQRKGTTKKRGAPGGEGLRSMAEIQRNGGNGMESLVKEGARERKKSTRMLAE